MGFQLLRTHIARGARCLAMMGTAGVFTVASHAGVVISDDFDDNAFDGGVWSTNLSGPQCCESVVEQNQRMEISNRGYLNTLSQYDPISQNGVKINCHWTVISTTDHVIILTRSDGTPSGSFGEPQNGVQFRFDTPTYISIIGSGSAVVSGGGTDLSSAIASGDVFDITIIDDGFNLQLNATRIVGVSESVSVSGTCATDMPTDLISFTNREFSGTSHTAYLDDVIIETNIVPNVLVIATVGQAITNQASVDFQVTFDQAVTGIDTSDFAIDAIGGISGASISNVSGSGTTYTVTVDTGIGDGTLSIDLVDDDSAISSAGVSVGGLGAGNGGFTSGGSYSIDKTSPTITLSSAAVATVNGAIAVNVLLSEASTDFVSGDITPTNASVSGFNGSGTAYSFTLTPLADGVFSAQVNGGTFADAATNGNTASNMLSRTADLTDPVFGNIAAAPSSAQEGNTVSITFDASETLQSNPTVTVNANTASFVGAVGLTYTYTYTVLGADPTTAATIDIFGTDLAGNNGFASNNSVLTIIPVPPSVALVAWPGIIALAAAGAMVLRKRKK